MSEQKHSSEPWPKQNWSDETFLATNLARLSSIAAEKIYNRLDSLPPTGWVHAVDFLPANVTTDYAGQRCFINLLRGLIAEIFAEQESQLTAAQAEIAELRSKLAPIDPGGGTKLDELDMVVEFLRNERDMLKAEIEKRAGEMVAMEAVEAGLRADLEERQDDIKIIAALNAKIERMEAEVERFREWAWHKPICNFPVGDCTCGLSELLREKWVGK